MRPFLAAAAAVFLQAATCQSAVDPKKSLVLDKFLVEKLASDQRKQSQSIKEQIQRLKKTNAKKFPLFDFKTNNSVRGSPQHDGDRKLQQYSVMCSEGYIGYESWGGLAFDILNNYLNNLPGKTWTLCPNTVFNGDILISDSSGSELTYLWVLQSNTVLRCGTSGSSDGNCIIANGGFSGVFIERAGSDPAVTGVQLQGLTFGTTSTYGANAYGVVAQDDTEATIQDCVFEGTVSTNDALYFGVFASGGVVLSIVDSEFNNNIYGTGIVAGSSSVSISRTRFDDNLNVYTNNMISAINGGTLSMTDSCFTKNIGVFADGVVIIDATSTLLSNVNNYGSENSGDVSSTSPFCNGALLNATYTCLPFDATVCALDPTPAPVTPAPIIPAPVSPVQTNNPTRAPVANSSGGDGPASPSSPSQPSAPTSPNSPSQPSPNSPSSPSSSTEDSSSDGGDDNTPIIAGAAAGGGFLILAAAGGAMYAYKAGKAHGSTNNSVGGGNSAAAYPTTPPPIVSSVPAPAPAPEPMPATVEAPSVGSSSAPMVRTKTVVRKVIAADGTETITTETIPI